jgi:hypothetical protein
MSNQLSNAALVLASGTAKVWALLKHACRSAMMRPGRYHPEAHYMRGPGPKWRAKHTKLSTQRS